jgi:hypothetical protein
MWSSSLWHVLRRESRRKTAVIVAIKGKDREFGDAAVSRVSVDVEAREDIESN